MEFIALANHRKAIRAEIAAAARSFHRMQLETLSQALDRYGVDPQRWPATSVIVMMTGIARYLLIEKTFDVDVGNDETMAEMERHIRELEGERRPIDEDVLTTEAQQ
jgi:hypothetical protein